MDFLFFKSSGGPLEAELACDHYCKDFCPHSAKNHICVSESVCISFL